MRKKRKNNGKKEMNERKKKGKKEKNKEHGVWKAWGSREGGGSELDVEWYGQLELGKAYFKEEEWAEWTGGKVVVGRGVGWVSGLWGKE